MKRLIGWILITAFISIGGISEKSLAADRAIKLILNKTVFHALDEFRLQVNLNNMGPPIAVKEYIVLDILGQMYFFWPGWRPGIDYMDRDLPTEYDFTHEVLYFGWPENVGSLDNLRFWAVMLDRYNQIVGDYDMIAWSYE